VRLTINQFFSKSILNNSFVCHIHRFYELQDLCLGIGLNQNGIMALRNAVDASSETKMNFEESNVMLGGKGCSEAPWSTSFPDPKSTITGIDPKTGTLRP